MQDQKDKELNRRFSLKNVLRGKINQHNEQPLADFEVPTTKISEKEVKSPKAQFEKSADGLSQEKRKKLEKSETTAAITSQQTVSSEETQKIKEVENILADNLKDVFIKMDPITQQQFKVKGEDTARAINVLLQKTKVKIKEIIRLIIDWLKLIPGVSRIFVEQEAKIKTDKLLKMKRKMERKESGN